MGVGYASEGVIAGARKRRVVRIIDRAPLVGGERDPGVERLEEDLAMRRHVSDARPAGEPDGEVPRHLATSDDPPPIEDLADDVGAHELGELRQRDRLVTVAGGEGGRDVGDDWTLDAAEGTAAGTLP